MEYILLKRDSIEWNILWDKLSKHPINSNIDEPNIALNNEETWQYVGSYRKGDKLISHLRHRCHPITNKVYNFNFEHSIDFDIESIDVSKKIR